MVLNPSYPSIIPSSKLLASKYPLHSTLGLFGTFIGTLVAIVLIPKDPYPAGALFPSAVAMTVGLLFAPVVASIRNPKTALRAEHLLILSPIYWLLLELLQGAYNLVDVDKPAIEGAFIAIGLFVGGIWLATLSRRPWQLPKFVMRSTLYLLTPDIIFRLVWVFFGLGIFKYAFACQFNPLTMLHYLGQNRWSAPWVRGQLGSWDAFLDHMSYFGYLLPTLTVLLALRSRWLNYKVIVSILFTLIMAVFLAQGGSRRITGVIFGAAIIVWILEQKKVHFKQLIILIFSILILLSSMQFLLEYRGIGYKAFFSDEIEQNQYEYLHVDDNFLRLAQIINIVPKRHPYIYEKQIIYTLVRPIPRALWPDKPQDSGFDLAQAVGKEGVSLSSSVIGELYLSAGWIGVLFGGWVYGRLASMVSRLLLEVAESWSSSAIIYGLSAMTLFAGVRSMLDLVLMSYALLAWIIVSKLLLKKQKLISS